MGFSGSFQTKGGIRSHGYFMGLQEHFKKIIGILRVLQWDCFFMESEEFQSVQGYVKGITGALDTLH